MGLTPFPAKLVLRLAELVGASTFIETGTFHGERAKWAAEHFKTVHTIELGVKRYNVTKAWLGPRLPNVTFHRGDSRQVLLTINHGPAAFWLDGHWSGDDTSGEHDQCPLLGELKYVSDQDIVLIDDARLFLQVPFPPHDVSQWPTLQEVIAAIPAGMFVQVIGDVIFAVPEKLREELTRWLYEGRSCV
jgi:hypothetical protein